MPYEQANLDIDAESFTSREKKLVKRLREYRTIDGDIAVYKAHANGFGLFHQPSITAAGPERDYLPYLRYLSISELDETEEELANAIKKYIQPDRYIYASQYRVARDVGKVKVKDPVDKQLLTIAHRALHRQEEESLKLTDTERTAEARLLERAFYEQKLESLLSRKQIINLALEQMKIYFPEFYTIIWYRYVQNENWKHVCKLAARNNETPLTDDEYRLSRKKALHQFDKWAVGLT